jgi:uridylate kinase
MVTVISLGGSIVAPDMVDEKFLRDFTTLTGEMLAGDRERRFIFVVGGGAPARNWQNAYRQAAEHYSDEEADWIGIMATRLNAQLVKAIMGDWCLEPVVNDPTEPGPFTGRVLTASGWKPGFSSDYDAALLAERFGAKEIINLSNISQVFTADPRIDSSATPIDAISWTDFRAMTGEEWVPGKNVPFDPVASRHCAEKGIRVIVAAGRNLENLRAILEGAPFIGTVIG